MAKKTKIKLSDTEINVAKSKNKSKFYLVVIDGAARVKEMESKESMQQYIRRNVFRNVLMFQGKEITKHFRR